MCSHFWVHMKSTPEIHFLYLSNKEIYCTWRLATSSVFYIPKNAIYLIFFCFSWAIVPKFKCHDQVKVNNPCLDTHYELVCIPFECFCFHTVVRCVCVCVCISQYFFNVFSGPILRLVMSGYVRGTSDRICECVEAYKRVWV
jgi:hypothetical protein